MFQKFVSGLCVFALLFMGVCGGRGCGEYCLLHVKKNYVCHPSVRFVYNGRMIRAPHLNSGDPKLQQIDSITS